MVGGSIGTLSAGTITTMLPWKKHKFELIEEDQQSKRKGYAVTLNYSALTSLARACPESALRRVGAMFRSKRKTVKITGEDPTYTVLYLGNATTIQSKGDGCTDAAVGRIWKKSELGRSGTRMRLTVGAHGLRMVHADDRARRPGHLYLLHRITYCVADPRMPKVFAWVYRHEMKHKAVMLRCHAVLASKPEKARAMALLLYQTSAAALAEFKRLKRRDDARHQQQGAAGEMGGVPLVPVRKLLLNTPCCYKPPAERSRSAPRLGSITEDLRGEEEEERDLDCDPLVGGLGGLCIGNDVRTLCADPRVTRLLSGDRDSSIDSVPTQLVSGKMMQEIG